MKFVVSGRVCFPWVLSILFSCWSLQAGSDRYQVQTLDDQVAGGYQVAVADLDGDGQIDVLALGTVLHWLHSPDWEVSSINDDDQAGNIDLAPRDVNQDGWLDVAVASEFSMENTGKGGLVQWFERKSGSNRAWISHPIDREPTAHRLRWADLEGNGRSVLVVAPIMGPGTSGPTYGQAGARLVFYRVPDNPESDGWPKRLIDDTLPVLHGLLVYDWDSDGRDELLTASRMGVHLFQFEGAGESLRWSRTQLCSGDQSGASAQGSSEVTVGHTADGRRFIATIEPWHGNQLVLYRAPKSGTLWKRTVLDDSLVEGHAVLAADLDGDGSDEVYAGFRGGRGGIVGFATRSNDAIKWDRIVVDDGGVACQGLNLLRLPDGRTGLLGIGGASHNLRLYTIAGD